MTTAAAPNPAASAPLACPHCGLVQRLPALAVPEGSALACARCESTLSTRPHHGRASARAAAFALGALILYPAAMLLPVLEISRLGHRHSATILEGVRELMKDGHWAIAVIVFVCSVFAPVGKIVGTLMVCLGGRVLARRHRQLLYRAIEWIGRWGMIDVLLVAILVAAVKLGSWMDVHAGPGALAFGAVVVLSLLASACFDPRAIWHEESA